VVIKALKDFFRLPTIDVLSQICRQLIRPEKNYEPAKIAIAMTLVPDKLRPY